MMKLSWWSAYNFTHPRNWYPLPDGAIKSKDMPKLKPLHELNVTECQFHSDESDAFNDETVETRPSDYDASMCRRWLLKLFLLLDQDLAGRYASS